MIVDMSQAAVNRTAMYHISHHIYSVLEPIRSGCQFFGRTFDTIPSPTLIQDMQAAAFSIALSDPVSLLSGYDVRSDRESNTPVLYLDPLYVLFGELRSEDTVFVLDLSTVTSPHWHGPSVSLAYDTAFDLICDRQPNVIAISHNTADTFYANYGFPRGRIHVLPLYVPPHLTDKETFEPFYSSEPYVLFVGSLERRKNLVGAMESFRISGLGDRGFRLIIAGGMGHGGDEIQQYANKLRNIFFTGFVSNSELRALYASASAFIYPSYLEGFGVPLLEAMNAGIPSVASNTGACPEVGGDLIQYYDPDDHLSFARELVRLVSLGDVEREAFSSAARRRTAEKFSVAQFGTSLKSIFNIPA